MLSLPHHIVYAFPKAEEYAVDASGLGSMRF